MDGEIWVESEPGKGSTFYFNVEVAQGDEKERVLPLNKTIAGRHALVIDDSNTSREIMKAMLTRLKKARDLVSQYQYQYEDALTLLTDIEMKSMQNHTIIGHQILSKNDTPLFKMADEVALNHHEK